MPEIAAAMRALGRRPVRLTTSGYLGHRRELYALGVAPGVLIASRHAASGADPSRPETGAIVFGAIGLAGFAGAVIAGRLADRIGRATTTSAAMLMSAGCCLLRPLAFRSSTAVQSALLLLWGAAIRYAGSALTLQPALGFALTIASIRLVPVAVNAVGWRFALLPLAIGPLAGTVAILRLRALPAARRLARGRG
jgi:MFS family permease